jgi:hypothetical protein
VASELGHFRNEVVVRGDFHRAVGDGGGRVAVRVRIVGRRNPRMGRILVPLWVKTGVNRSIETINAGS